MLDKAIFTATHKISNLTIPPTNNNLTMKMVFLRQSIRCINKFSTTVVHIVFIMPLESKIRAYHYKDKYNTRKKWKKVFFFFSFSPHFFRRFWTKNPNHLWTKKWRLLCHIYTFIAIPQQIQNTTKYAKNFLNELLIPFLYF